MVQTGDILRQYKLDCLKTLNKKSVVEKMFYTCSSVFIRSNIFHYLSTIFIKICAYRLSLKTQHIFVLSRSTATLSFFIPLDTSKFLYALSWLNGMRKWEQRWKGYKEAEKNKSANEKWMSVQETRR